MKVNSVLYVKCSKLVHKKCSGVKGLLKKVEGVFQCKVCVQDRVMDDVVESMDNGSERVEDFG